MVVAAARTMDVAFLGLEVRLDLRAARLQGAKGFLLWNASGIYTKSALAPPS